MDSEKKLIYLDYAATSPVRHEVIEVMENFNINNYGNPSSIHTIGRKARAAVDQARMEIAEILSCGEQEIYFTSGGTESNNLAIAGIIEAIKVKNGQKPPHIIISEIEHASIYNNVKEIEDWEAAEVTYLPINADGVINLDELKAAIKPETVLVSVMYTNNEIGTVQPIEEIGKILTHIHEEKGQRIYFHTDAVQAAEYFTLNVESLHVDALTLSAHKFGGPKGIGLLYVKKDVPIVPLTVGGLQELKLRPGTENVAGIVGMARALGLASEEHNKKIDNKMMELRDYFEDQLLKNLPETLIIGSKVLRSPAITSAVFAGLDGAMLVMNLDLSGVCVSSGAACSSGSLKLSHVARALDLKRPYNSGPIRFSFGKSTTREELDQTLRLIGEIVQRIKAGA